MTELNTLFHFPFYWTIFDIFLIIFSFRDISIFCNMDIWLMKSMWKILHCRYHQTVRNNDGITNVSCGQKVYILTLSASAKRRAVTVTTNTNRHTCTTAIINRQHPEILPNNKTQASVHTVPYCMHLDNISKIIYWKDHYPGWMFTTKT